MTPFRPLLMLTLGFAASAGVALAAGPTDPIEVAQLPYLEIFSPTFFWDDKADFVRVGSTTCPKGRAITGGLNIVQGKASLRILESYPDGESWVVRVVNRQKAAKVESVQVRGYALCMLPAARKASVMLTQRPHLQYVSTKFSLPGGDTSGKERQTCPKGSLVIAGGLGLDPDYRGPSDLRMELSYPDPEGWNVHAINSAEKGGAPADVRAYAICLGNKDGVDIRNLKTIYFASADVAIKADNGTARQSVACGEQAYVLGGGSRTIRGRSASVETQESFPDSPSSWTVGVINRGDKRSGDATVKVFAVCLKK
jgi:hypothetical protein